MEYEEALGVLNMSGGESDAEFAKKSRLALRRSHPDMGGSSEEFIRVQEAIDVVKRFMADRVRDAVFVFGASVLEVVLVDENKVRVSENV